MKNKLSEADEINILLTNTFDLFGPRGFNIYKSTEMSNESEHFIITMRLERKKEK